MMDGFQIIQRFFCRMTCNHCSQPFEPDGIELIREERGVYIVSVYCHHCERQVGVAMVGVENPSDGNGPIRAEVSMRRPVDRSRFPDPELTEEELERLGDFPPINLDDVLQAHHFFQGLDADWMKHIPDTLRASATEDDDAAE